MKNINVMIKPASSLCNMRCKYCFYADVSNKREVCSFGIMKDETMTSIIDNIFLCLNKDDRVNFAFQGGEPTLAGIEFFEKFVQAVSAHKDISVTYALQTNALVIDENWCEFLKKYNFLVGVSFDILKEAHDEVRIEQNNKGTYDKVVTSMELLKKYDVDFNVLCTLTNNVARHPEKVWKELKKLGIDYVQFTPCLGELDNDKNTYALTPQRFSSFYTQLFNYWYEDYKSGNYISVKFFDDIVNQIILGYPTMCGMDGRCRAQFVVEADGSVYPCDFYCLDEYKMGNISKSRFDELLSNINVEKFLSMQGEENKICKNCQYKKFCGGNCKRMRNEICIGRDKKYCGYKEFLDSCGEELALLAQKLIKNR